MNSAVASKRLRHQLITRAGLARPADVVAWFGAMQAQVYDAARWGIGLRLRDATDEGVERAFDQGRILRTHVMRPTWHFVTPSDIRWLLELTAPRVHRTMLPYRRRLELDPRTLVRTTTWIERALGDGPPLTRQELAGVLRRRGMTFDGFRLGLVAMYAELEGVICSGPRRGKQFTYALIAQRAPR
ncbi:MAG TPA: crosslink repair DNA glycosylase YcaQ family protein, partial [Vicinamibacterales bacterium]|nr:crosslink repair DNA glycosylase YcaQ family protein [Vicinamibacterales bacterium]